jgi:hypothetical protein
MLSFVSHFQFLNLFVLSRACIYLFSNLKLSKYCAKNTSFYKWTFFKFTNTKRRERERETESGWIDWSYACDSVLRDSGDRWNSLTPKLRESGYGSLRRCLLKVSILLSFAVSQWLDLAEATRVSRVEVHKTRYAIVERGLCTTSHLYFIVCFVTVHGHLFVYVIMLSQVFDLGKRNGNFHDITRHENRDGE